MYLSAEISHFTSQGKGSLSPVDKGKSCKHSYTVKNAVYWNAPGEQYFHVSMVTHTVTTETGKYCSSPEAFTFFTVYISSEGPTY